MQSIVMKILFKSLTLCFIALGFLSNCNSAEKNKAYKISNKPQHYPHFRLTIWAGPIFPALEIPALKLQILTNRLMKAFNR